MFVKKKNFRRKVKDSEGDGDEELEPSGKGSASRGVAPGKPKARPPSRSGTDGPLSFGGDSKPKTHPKPRAGSSTLLSFGDDEEEDQLQSYAVKLKKRPGALGSHKALGILARDAPDHPPSAMASSIQAAAGEYTSERLAELARNMRKIGPPISIERDRASPRTGSPATVPGAPSPSREPVIVLKGGFKPAPGFEAGPSHTEQFAGESGGVGAPSSLGASGALGSLGITGLASSGLSSAGVTFIPDAEQIRAARAQREKMRQARTAPDYIPLEGQGFDEGRSAAGSVGRNQFGKESALVRENDEDRSSEDEAEVRGRMKFLGDAKKGAGVGAKGGGVAARGVFEAGAVAVETEEVRGDTAAADGVDDEVEDLERWEVEQMRKAVGKRAEEQGQAAQAVAVAPAEGLLVQPGAVGSGALGPGALGGNVPMVSRGFGGTAVWAPGGQGGSMPSALGPVGVGFGLAASLRRAREETGAALGGAAMAALRMSLQKTRESEERVQGELQRVGEGLFGALRNVEGLEKQLEKASGKYRYVQELREYIANLCECLRDKGPLIEELEEHMQRLHEERAAALTTRRLADGNDEATEVSAAMAAATAALGRGVGGAVASAAAAAGAAAAEAVRRCAEEVAPEVDEFGRDVNLQKRLDAKKRAEGRRRRRERAAARRGGGAGEGSNGAPAVVADPSGRALDGGSSGAPVSRPLEGESSSEESEGEVEAYISGREEVLATAGAVLRDAAEEFGELGKVKERLEGWKRQYPDSYRDAYVSLSAPALFAPYVRLELLHWDPLYGDAGFDNMGWYSALFDYGMGAEGQEPDPEDADANLIPKLVEKVTLPSLHHDLAHCWDVASPAMSARAAAATAEVLIYLPPDSAAVMDLLDVIKERLTDAVAKLDLPAWAPALCAIVPQAAAVSTRQFGLALRILRSIGTWKEVLSREVIDSMALNQLLVGKLIPHLQALVSTPHDAITRAGRVLEGLSHLWSCPLPDLEETEVKKLDTFLEYLELVRMALKNRKDAGISGEGEVKLAQELVDMFLGLNQRDKARKAAKAFGLGVIAKT